MPLSHWNSARRGNRRQKCPRIGVIQPKCQNKGKNALDRVHFSPKWQKKGKNALDRVQFSPK
ncbi:hypothetical protein BSK55_21305 [Paenibacillus odorifer]|nr:hypothetical protein BSK55_21305 [Paenibacillus odorifer]